MPGPPRPAGAARAQVPGAGQDGAGASAGQARGGAPRAGRGEDARARSGRAGKETKALEFTAAEGPPALVRAPSMPPIAAPPLPPTRLIFFVGQGGVGKSSCAAAAAVTLTEKEGPVLLISTDPAHSLSDVLQSRLTDTETQVKGTKGLYARELDARRLVQRASQAAEGEGGAGLRGAPARARTCPCDREVLRNLLDVAPPGHRRAGGDVRASPTRWCRSASSGSWWIPAPPAASLRLVELPEHGQGLADRRCTACCRSTAPRGWASWRTSAPRMLKHVKRFEEALASPTESRFVVVTRGEELAAAKYRAAGGVPQGAQARGGAGARQPRAAQVHLREVREPPQERAASTPRRWRRRSACPSPWRRRSAVTRRACASSRPSAPRGTRCPPTATKIKAA